MQKTSTGSSAVKEKQVPEKRLLKYKPGDLIVKEGDFGIALYRVVSGTVTILKEHDGRDAFLSELGQGDIFGEMVFIDGGFSPRTASVQAKDDVAVEAWHYLSVRSEYEAANPIIRLLAADMVRKLQKISAIHDRLRLEKQPPKEEPEEKPAEVSASEDFWKPMPEESNEIKIEVKAPETTFKLAGGGGVGKEWEGKVEYRLPLNPEPRMLSATGVDMDDAGIRIDVPASNMNEGGHEPGSPVDLMIHLPGITPVSVSGVVTSLSRGSMVGHTALRIAYRDVLPDARESIDDFLKT